MNKTRVHGIFSKVQAAEERLPVEIRQHAEADEHRGDQEDPQQRVALFTRWLCLVVRAGKRSMACSGDEDVSVFAAAGCTAALAG